jgi:hypothetical protein
MECIKWVGAKSFCSKFEKVVATETDIVEVYGVLCGVEGESIANEWEQDHSITVPKHIRLFQVENIMSLVACGTPSHEVDFVFWVS